MSEEVEPTDFKQKILKWLRSEGYPLEMTTARAFQAAGASVEAGADHVDPDTKVPREIDVVASFRHAPTTGDVGVEVCFVCECKLSRDRPWILFTNPSAPNALTLDGRVSHSQWAKPLAAISKWCGTREIDLAGVSAYGGAVAVFKREGRQDNDNVDVMFKALSSAAKASYSIAIERHQGEPSILRVVFPVVVVDAPLFGCAQDAAGEIDLQELNGIVLRWRRPIGGRDHTFVDIVNAGHLEAYVDQCADLAEDLADELRRSGPVT